MRDKIGCRYDFDHNLQNLSESFGNLNIIRNTMEKHRRVINKVVDRLFSQLKKQNGTSLKLVLLLAEEQFSQPLTHLLISA